MRNTKTPKRGTLAEAGTDALLDPEPRRVPRRSRVGRGWVVCNSSENRWTVPPNSSTENVLCLHILRLTAQPIPQTFPNGIPFIAYTGP